MIESRMLCAAETTYNVISGSMSKWSDDCFKKSINVGITYTFFQQDVDDVWKLEILKAAYLLLPL